MSAQDTVSVLCLMGLYLCSSSFTQTAKRGLSVSVGAGKNSIQVNCIQFNSSLFV